MASKKTRIVPESEREARREALRLATDNGRFIQTAETAVATAEVYLNFLLGKK